MKRKGIQAGAERGRRDARLILDVSLSPDYVRGTVSAEGRATGFEGWLGLAQAVATAASAPGGASITGPDLLQGDGTIADARRRRMERDQ